MTAMAPVHEIPRAALKDSTEQTSVEDGSEKRNKDKKCLIFFSIKHHNIVQKTTEEDRRTHELKVDTTHID